MPQKSLPVVSDQFLHLPDQQASKRPPIVIGSEQWYSWLAEEQNRSFSFRSDLGTFTVRCEHKRHGWYWYLYRKSAGKLRKAYLGKAEELTFERLGQGAATLVAQPDHSDEPGNGLRRAGARAHPGHTSLLSESQLSGPPPTIIPLAQLPSITIPPLPLPLTPLIGRKLEIATVCWQLRQAQVRLLVLTGPGGIGKTRLALQVALDLRQDFPAGVCFVSLETVRDPAQVAHTIATALGLRETTRTSVVDQLKNALREQRHLLLLDNFEQVAPAAPLLADLLVACPHLNVLVSSRTRLHIRGEQEYAVPPLALPDPGQLAEGGALSQYAAVAFFLQCVWTLQPEFQVTSSSVRTIAEICLRLEGVPLAIELAAARIKQLPPPALLARLERCLPVLTNGAQDAPVRQQTMRQTLAWSYALLDPWEQRVLRHLSVFVGGCTLQAAEAICGGREDGLVAEQTNVFDGIASLIDTSLLSQTPREGEEPRFAMLEITREYGQELLALGEETESAREAHADYYLLLAEQAAHAWEGPQQVLWVRRLERDHDNLRAAMQWSLEQERGRDRLEKAFRFGAALRSFWQVRGYFREGRIFLERVLAQSEESQPFWRAQALNDAVLLAVSQGDHRWGEVRCQENLERSRALGDGSAMARTLYLLGWLALLKGDLVTAQTRLSESLALFQEGSDTGGILVSLFWMGVGLTYQGEYRRARAVFEQTLARQRERGNKRGIAWSLFHLAWMHFLAQGAPLAGDAWLAEAGALFKEIGDTWGIAECSHLLGQLALHQRDAGAASVLLEQGLVLFKEIGNQRGMARSFSQLGEVAALRQDWTKARQLSAESLAQAQEMGDRLQLAACLEGIAGTVAAGEASLADVLWAAQLWGAAEALRETMGTPLPPVEQAIAQERVAIARRAIGKRIFSAYWAQGRTMTPDQALAAQGKAAMSSQRPTEPPSIASKSTGANLPGLTAREVEVLHWVALGLTDAQVAEQLVISPRTVTSHLSSIYNKLGVTSRAAATRFALDHQLV